MTITAAQSRKLRDVRTLAEKLLAEFGLADSWKIVFDNAKARNGLTDSVAKKISLSRPLALVRDSADTENTIRHEISHALSGPGHGHDATWRRMCAVTGAMPRRCSLDDHDKEISVWIGTCRNGHKTYRNRLTDKARNHISCGQCAPHYDEQNRFTWKRR